MPKKPVETEMAGDNDKLPDAVGDAVLPAAVPRAAVPPAADIIRHMASINPVWKLLGVELLEAEHGRTKLAMPVVTQFSNTFGNAHGGFLFAFADLCFGFTANAARNEKAVSSSAEIHWLAPGQVGTRVIGEATEVWHKGRNGLYDVRIWNEADGEVIAIVHGRMRFIGGKVLEP